MVQVSPKVNALKNMNNSLDGELRSLLTYFGEDPDSPEAPKLEDFFGLILSFSLALQVISPPLSCHLHMFRTDFPFFRKKSALEVEDARKVYSLLEMPKIVLEEEDPTGGNVRQRRMDYGFVF